jgi:hypothetical protein
LTAAAQSSLSRPTRRSTNPRGDIGEINPQHANDIKIETERNNVFMTISQMKETD